MAFLQLRDYSRGEKMARLVNVLQKFEVDWFVTFREILTNCLKNTVSERTLSNLLDGTLEQSDKLLRIFYNSTFSSLK